MNDIIKFDFYSRKHLDVKTYTMGKSTITISGEGSLGIFDTDGTPSYKYQVRIDGPTQEIKKIKEDMVQTGLLPQLAKAKRA